MGDRLGSMTLTADAGANANASQSSGGKGRSGADDRCCASCSKVCSTLKRCTACKSVWYCGVNCQIDHRKAHKKECKRIRKELEAQEEQGVEERTGGKKEEKFGLWNPKPREECPICMVVMPLNPELETYMQCCGKVICSGCMYANEIATLDTNARKADGEALVDSACPFCRRPVAETVEELLRCMRIRADSGDAYAIYQMAAHMKNGNHGLPMDESKILELTQEAADLGHPRANMHMGDHYIHGTSGFVENESQAKLHWEVAAKRGDHKSRMRLGAMEYSNKNFFVAIRHFHIAARSGHRGAINVLKECAEIGMISQNELEASERACDGALEEMRSEERDEFIQYLKYEGKYDGDISDFYFQDMPMADIRRTGRS